MNESEQNFCFEDRRLSLIDVSFEDDCLYSSPSHDFHVRVSDAAKTEAKSNLGLTDANYTQFDGGEVGAEPVESMEAERMKKKKKYNLRKSIAWDSAFFTSAGVLEPEELSTMMGGGKHMLPGIDEDIHKSTDSISTLASDNLTLENLDTDLFGDIRASIQRSTKGSDVGNSTSEVVSLETENTCIPSLEKADVSSQNKLKAKTAPNKPNAVMQGTEKIAKQSTPVNGDSKSLCRPPKIASRAGPILAPATKRASLGANRVKVEKSKDSPENEKRLTGRGAKVPALGGPRNVVPRPTLPVKSSLRSSSVLKTQLKTSLGVGSSGSLSSDNSSKSSLNFMRRKDDSRTGNHFSSTSNVKTTLKLPSRNKNQSTSSHLPHLKSVNKRSSNISPASSISEWSSASLSPTSTLNKMSNSSRSSFDISSCKDASRDSDASQVMDSQHYFNDEHSVGHGTQVGSVGKCVNKATEGSSSVLHPDSAKPSGLRLPSPKIGFFDGVRSATRTPNRSKQSHEALPSGLPGPGAGSVSPSGGSNEAKLGKLQPARTAVRGTRIMDQVTASGMKSKSTLPLQESSIAALRVSSAVKNEKRNASISLKAQNRMSFQGERKSNLKDKKVGLEECNKSLNNSDGGYSERNGDACFLKGKKETESKGDAPEKDIKVTLCNGLPDITTDSSSIPKVENITSLEKLSGDVICSHNYIKDSLPFPYGTNEKEKLLLKIELMV
ncbi:cell wall protein [Salix suchowensis]|nr:cell wall protein [Salix suchowensis]